MPFDLTSCHFRIETYSLRTCEPNKTSSNHHSILNRRRPGLSGKEVRTLTLREITLSLYETGNLICDIQLGQVLFGIYEVIIDRFGGSVCFLL